MPSYTIERLQGRAGVDERIVATVSDVEAMDACSAIRLVVAIPESWEIEFDMGADEATVQNPDVDGGPGEITDYWRSFAEGGDDNR